MKISNLRQGAQTFFLDDLNSIINAQTLKFNRSLMSFIEVALKQHTIFNPAYFATYHSPIIYPLNGGIPAMPDKQLDEHRTKYLAAGIQKNAVLVEGDQQNGRQLGVTIGARYIPFHAVKSLLDYLGVHNGTQSLYSKFTKGFLKMEQLNRLNFIMRGIQLTVRYPDNTTRQLDNWSFAKAVANQEIIPEKDITVEDYYNNRYGKLRLPNAHLVKVKNNYYPAELLEISDNQEVSSDQMDSRTKDVLANESSIRPDKMQTANRQASRVFRLQDSPYVQAAGIVVAPNTTRCNARVLPTPTICGPNTRWRLPENGESSWPIKRLLNPKPCKGFAIYVIGGNQLPVDLKDFAQNFQRTAGRLGMNLGPCQDSGLYAENQIETCIKYCADPTKNIELCIFITPEHAIHCHEDIEYFERRHGVITQDLKPKTLRRLLAGDQSIYENCVLKANIKLGGLNYSLEVENREVMNELQETMIIGISSANLPEQKSIPKRNSSISDGKPNVLGYSVNSGKNFNETIGDFLYSPADNSSQHNNLRKIFKSCAQRFKENRGQSPRKVLLYFYGLTQEQYKDCLKFYVPMIQLGIREANNKIDIPLTIMPVTKKNNVRLFPQRFPPDQCKKNYEFNVPHGIVVDSTIVNPIFNEFFLMSHSAPSGTANIPRYTVVFDQNSYSMNVLEELSHNLCYQHQIDGVSTALPTVIGVAEDYAGRGRDLFNAAIRNNHSLPYTNDGQPDLDRLTQILNYSDSRFNNVRITA